MKGRSGALSNSHDWMKDGGLSGISLPDDLKVIDEEKTIIISENSDNWSKFNHD